jgi:hypothetical protein
MSEGQTNLRGGPGISVKSGQGKTTISLLPNKLPQQSSRACVLTGGITDISGGGSNVDMTVYDGDMPDYDAYVQTKLGTIASNIFTFSIEGFFLVNYCSVVELDLSASANFLPEVVEVRMLLKLGATSLDRSTSVIGQSRFPNFTGVVRTNDAGDSLDQSIDISSLVVETPVISTTTAVDCDSLEVVEFQSGEFAITSYSCTSDLATTAETVDGKWQSTPVTGDFEVDSNAAAVSDYDPDSFGTATAAGMALVRVIRNSSGVLKILDGATERDPTLSLFGSCTGTAITLNSTISILKL